MFEEEDGLFSTGNGGDDDSLFPDAGALDGALARGAGKVGKVSATSPSGPPLSAMLLKAAVGLEQSAVRATELEEEVARLTSALAKAEESTAAATEALSQSAGTEDTAAAAAAALEQANSRADAAEKEAAELKLAEDNTSELKAQA
eukprot:gene9832-29958_t